MNKKELIIHVAEAANLSKASAERAVDAVFTGINGALVAKEDATFVGFGSFRVEPRAARAGRNPQTGETIQIEAKNAIKFKPSAELKKSVN